MALPDSLRKAERSKKIPQIDCDIWKRLNPLLLLAVINLSQIENRLLDNAIGSATPIFHDRPIAMLLAVFPTGRTAQKHDPCRSASLGKPPRPGQPAA
jgi:hypothetical protein